MEHLLALLDNPQEKYNVVHIAGTSGKGSCAYLTSLILASQDLKTGMSLSPHVVDVRERCQINNQYISKEKFSQYLSEIIPTIEVVDKSEWGKVTYFEVLTALAYHAFYKEAVDVAVMETGMGGLLDATNVVKREDKVVIISKIGLDHTAILGDTIRKIALQKAGIIKSNNFVVTTAQDKQAKDVIEKASQTHKAELYTVTKRDFQIREMSIKRGVFSLKVFGEKRIFKLGLIGEHMVENCALALLAAEQILKRKSLIVKENKLDSALSFARFPARFELKKFNNKLVIFDGAHNKQKMRAFIKALNLTDNKKFTFLIAFKRDKEIPEMLEMIVPKAQKIILTSFNVKGQDFVQVSKTPQEVSVILKKISFNNFEIIENPIEAFKYALEEKNLVVTGSFYLISQIYGKYY